MSTEETLRSRLPMLAVVVVVGLNLRPFLTAVGPLAADISAQTGLAYQDMALLTLVPMLLMGALAFLGPAIQRRFGARRAVIAALIVLASGSLLRYFAWDGRVLVLTAVLCGLGVAVVQALFPGIIKLHFPDRVTLVTGLYSSMLMGGGAVGAQVAPLVAKATADWRLGLAWLAIPAIIAVLMAARFLPRANGQGASAPAMAFLRRPRTWLLMLSFGLVNGGYSTVVAWLAAFYQGHGWSAAASGSLLAVVALGQAASALLMPILASRNLDRRCWIWLTLAMQLIGFAGLAFLPYTAPIIWALVVGAGLGGCFALTMVVALDHLPNPAQAGALSALMQGGGFLLAALPPWIVATLHEATGGFIAGWILHIGCVLVVSLLVLRLNPAGYAKAMSLPNAQPNSLQNQVISSPVSSR
ncbi:MFS transporter [Devosia sp. D6-9]|nr:MFS transporter [Devosia sp. D6-9]